ncbi:class I SAM-dependent methyltransferase [Nocardiopsis oceani]
MATKVGRVQLDEVEETLLWTVYSKVLDFRNAHPVLGDIWAVDVFDRLDFDQRALRGATDNRYMVLLRARCIDTWARRWIAENPEGTVLHLACGLDARALRLGLPRGGRWFDLDLPSVVELRRGLLPEPEGYRLLSGSVTDPDWLDQVPADAPVLVIAEGLVEYLPTEQTRLLLDRLVDHFSRGGELVFDTVRPWVGRMARMVGRQMHGMADPRSPEHWNPRLALAEDFPLMSGHEEVPERFYRASYQLMNGWEPTRSAMRVSRFRF